MGVLQRVHSPLVTPGKTTPKTRAKPKKRPPARRGDLSLDAIVDHACAIAHDEGLDAVTMRRLASDLGVAPNALYWHVESRDLLLDHVVDRVLAKVVIPTERGSWRTRSRRLLESLHATLSHHPGVAREIDIRSRYVPSLAPIITFAMRTLLNAGFDDVAASSAVLIMANYTMGRAEADAERRLTWGGGQDADLQSGEAALARFTRLATGANVDITPEVLIYGSTLVNVPEVNSGAFMDGVEVLLDGLERRLPASR